MGSCNFYSTQHSPLVKRKLVKKCPTVAVPTTATVLHLQTHANAKLVVHAIVNPVANALHANVPPLVVVDLLAIVQQAKTVVHVNSDATVLHVIVTLNAVVILVAIAWLVKTLALVKLVVNVPVVIIVTVLIVVALEKNRNVAAKRVASVQPVKTLALAKTVENALAVITVIALDVAVVNLENRSVAVKSAANVWLVKMLVSVKLVASVLVGIIVTALNVVVAVRNQNVFARPVVNV